MNLFNQSNKPHYSEIKIVKYKIVKLHNVFISAIYFSLAFLVIFNHGCGKTVDLAVLKTNPIINISLTTKSSGGYIINNGGSEVTERGVCWSKNPNPTIKNFKTNDGTGKGKYISNITDLTIGYTYYVRAYATNDAGTSYGNQLSFTTSISGLSVGINYEGGVIAYIYPSSDSSQIHGFIAAPTDQSSGIPWYNGTFTTTGADSLILGTGNSNTNIIVANQGAGNYAAQICADLVLDGYNDWYLPSRDELNQLYLNRIEIGGFTTGYYWSSSEQNVSKAWKQDFLTGTQYFQESKHNPGYVRAIRSF